MTVCETAQVSGFYNKAPLKGSHSEAHAADVTDLRRVLPSGAGKSLLNRRKQWLQSVLHCCWNVGLERSVWRERWREGRGKNYRIYDAWALLWEGLSSDRRGNILQSVSLLTPACNRHKHARPAQATLVLHFHRIASLFKHAGRDGAHRRWWKRGKKGKRKKDASPGPWGCPWLWKICTFLSPHLRLESTVSRKRGS